METKLVNYKLPVDLIEQIEELSTGNKTALVTELLKQAICLRSIDEGVLMSMYSAAKNHRVKDRGIFGEYSPKELRVLIDGLHI
tara:strand:+ start:226 stop:477 length:252 start_codon:yes stop_codon:yes gene_type:complete